MMACESSRQFLRDDVGEFLAAEVGRPITRLAGVVLDGPLRTCSPVAIRAKHRPMVATAGHPFEERPTPLHEARVGLGSECGILRNELVVLFCQRGTLSAEGITFVAQARVGLLQSLTLLCICLALFGVRLRFEQKFFRTSPQVVHADSIGEERYEF